MTIQKNVLFALLLLINSRNILNLSWLKPWFPVVASTVKNGNDRLWKGNSLRREIREQEKKNKEEEREKQREKRKQAKANARLEHSQTLFHEVGVGRQNGVHAQS